jgi:membrane fusion protein (multidrug efflux system)
MIISKNHYLGLLLLLSLLTISACDSSDKASQGKRGKEVHHVEVISVTLEPLSHQQTVTGTLEAIISVRLYNEESGRITKLPYHEGDAVKKGEVIITLDGTLIQAELDKAVAEHKQAKADLLRLEKLVEKKLASEEVLSHAQTTLNVAAAEEKLQRTRFQLTTIKSPFSGVVTERNNEPGDAVPQHSHILSLIDPTALRIKMQLSESWLPMIGQGESVEITIDALSDTVYSGNITRIHPTIDPNTRKGVVEVELNPLPEGAQAGQLARVKIKSTPVSRLVIPSFAVHHDYKGAYVFVIGDENTAIKRYVQKGLQFGDQIEVVEGLSANEKVVTKGFNSLRDGKKVNIVKNNNDTP